MEMQVGINGGRAGGYSGLHHNSWCQSFDELANAQDRDEDPDQWSSLLDQMASSPSRSARLSEGDMAEHEVDGEQSA